MGLSFSKPKEIVTNNVHIHRNLICRDGGCSQFRELEKDLDTSDVVSRFQERLRVVIASPSTSPSERAILKAYLENLIQYRTDSV
jgi:hypothetical protein